ncbi:hypothetical protein [Streptacidiphilus cavernicola]|uniref:Uncharacterized protein n=1 Tax=Streptacidiphilus cavernicola TaxID=3342716 RepID=A0ABV6VYD0_9ACTN
MSGERERAARFALWWAELAEGQAGGAWRDAVRPRFEDSEHGRWLEAGGRFQADGAVAERMALMWARVAAVLAPAGESAG